MDVDRYYLIYSTMTLTTASLIGLVGIFIIFRIQLQRDRIRQAYIDMHKLLNLEPEVTTWDDLTQGIKEVLETKEDEKGKQQKAVEHKHNRVKKSKEILRYTINWGVFTLAYIGALFAIYIFVLHFHNELPFMETHRFQVEIATFALDMIAVIILLKYLITCILPKGDEYLY